MFITRALLLEVQLTRVVVNGYLKWYSSQDDECLQVSMFDLSTSVTFLMSQFASEIMI